MNRMRIAIGALIGVIVVIGGLAWWLGFFSDTPEEVSIDAAVAAVQDDDEADVADDPDADAEATTSTTTDISEPAEGINGTWTVRPDEDVTFVGYRINEVLNTIGDFEVVGRTRDVSGTLEADGTSINAVSLIARMDTLTTDNGGRDRAMRSQALETDQFPEATFALTSPIDLDAIPAAGETISVTATGDLTIHGVTRSVDFPLDAQLAGDAIVVVGQLPVLLADYDISAPSAPIVASVEDNAVLELSLAFEQT